jgi:hypothetical protein
VRFIRLSFPVTIFFTTLRGFFFLAFSHAACVETAWLGDTHGAGRPHLKGGDARCAVRSTYSAVFFSSL